MLRSWLVAASIIRQWSLPKLLVPAVKTYLPQRLAQFQSDHFIGPDHYEHPLYRMKYPDILERYYKITAFGAIFWAMFHQVQVAFKSEDIYKPGNLFRTLNVMEPITKQLIRYNPLYRPWSRFDVDCNRKV